MRFNEFNTLNLIFNFSASVFKVLVLLKNDSYTANRQNYQIIKFGLFQGHFLWYLTQISQPIKLFLRPHILPNQLTISIAAIEGMDVIMPGVWEIVILQCKIIALFNSLLRHKIPLFIKWERKGYNMPQHWGQRLQFQHLQMIINLPKWFYRILFVYFWCNYILHQLYIKYCYIFLFLHL